MRRALAAAAAALSYFTILPIARFAPDAAPDALALSFLPFVGALVGALAGAGGYGVWLLTHSTIWMAITAWTFSIALTGAIHVDGFLDSCDALFASVSPQRRLEILRDPRHGTYALAGMAVLGAIWLGALLQISPVRLIPAMIFAGTLARGAAALNAWFHPYGRAGEITPAFRERPNAVLVGLALLGAGALGWWIDPRLVWVVPLAAVISLAVGAWMARRLGGGLTGDAYGAIVCLCDVKALAIISAVSTSLGPGRFM